MHKSQSLVPVIATMKSCVFLMACVGESVSTNMRKGDGQRELQEESGKSKKRSIALNKFCGFIERKRIAGEQIFSNLAALLKSLLCIFHSNASRC